MKANAKKTAAQIIDETLIKGRAFMFQATWSIGGGWKKTRTYGDVSRVDGGFLIENNGKPSIRVEGDGAALCVVLRSLGMRDKEIYHNVVLNAEIFS